MNRIALKPSLVKAQSVNKIIVALALSFYLIGREVFFNVSIQLFFDAIIISGLAVGIKISYKVFNRNLNKTLDWQYCELELDEKLGQLKVVNVLQNTTVSSILHNCRITPFGCWISPVVEDDCKRAIKNKYLSCSLTTTGFFIFKNTMQAASYSRLCRIINWYADNTENDGFDS